MGCFLLYSKVILVQIPSILVWGIPWTEEPGGLQAMGSQSDMTEHAGKHTPLTLEALTPTR